MTGFPIGTWDFPSGNRVSVSLDQENCSGVRSLRCEWDRFPPSKRDQRYYRETVAPEIMGRLSEYLEVPGAKALYVEAE